MRTATSEICACRARMKRPENCAPPIGPPHEKERTARVKRRQLLLKISLSAVFIGAIVWAIKSHGIWTAGSNITSQVAHADPLALAACVACTAGATLIMIFRWHMLLRALRLRGPFSWTALVWSRSQVIGLLPTSEMGADVYRVDQARRRFGTVVLPIGVAAIERTCGLVALVSVVALALLVGFELPSVQHSNTSNWFTLGVPACAMIAILALTSERIRAPFLHRIARYRQLSRVLPSKWPSPHIILSCLALSLLIHGAVASSFVFVDQALHLHTPWWCYFIAVPATSLARYLPIHVAGLGVTEGGLFLVLNRCADVSAIDAVAIVALARGVSLTWRAALALAFLIPIDRTEYGGIAGHVVNRQQCVDSAPSVLLHRTKGELAPTPEVHRQPNNSSVSMNMSQEFAAPISGQGARK